MPEVLGRPKPFSTRAREVAKSLLRHENAVLVIVLIVLIGGMSVATKGLTTTATNIRNVLLQSAIRGVAAVGQATVILTAGIDLSVGGLGLVTSIIGGSLMTSELPKNIVGYPVSFYMAIPVMLLVGASLGTLSGLSVSRTGIPALIATLAMWEISKGLAFQISEGRTLYELPEVLSFFGQGVIAGVPVPVIIFITVAVLAYLVLNHTTYGRSIYAVGGNPVSAWLSGINVRNILLSVYIISGFLAGLAGVIILGRVMSTSMRTLTGLELDSIAAAVIGGVSLMGGRGTVLGAVIGAIIIGVINNGMSILGAGPAVQGIVKGSIIWSAVTIDYLRRR